MNEYSFLLKDSRGIYTIVDDKLSAIEYYGVYDDYNYGFFDTNEILKPNVYNELEECFEILICERNVPSATIVDIDNNDSDAELFEDRFALMYRDQYVLPNGDILPLDCDMTLLPKSITEYNDGVKQKDFLPTKIKDSGIYSFYSITIDRAEWVSIDKVEAI